MHAETFGSVVTFQTFTDKRFSDSNGLPLRCFLARIHKSSVESAMTTHTPTLNVVAKTTFKSLALPAKRTQQQNKILDIR